MVKFIKKFFYLGCIVSIMTIATSREMHAAPLKSHKSKTYTKKAPYSGFGKLSKINGLPKYKITSGYTKKTSKGYAYVNPYARSR